MNAAETTQEVMLSDRAQALLKNLHETLNEEKWTRASLGNYSTNQYKKQHNRALPLRNGSDLPPDY